MRIMWELLNITNTWVPTLTNEIRIQVSFACTWTLRQPLRGVILHPHHMFLPLNVAATPIGKSEWEPVHIIVLNISQVILIYDHWWESLFQHITRNSENLRCWSRKARSSGNKSSGFACELSHLLSVPQFPLLSNEDHSSIFLMACGN